jgi:hypothetical protein
MSAGPRADCFAPALTEINANRRQVTESVTLFTDSGRKMAQYHLYFLRQGMLVGSDDIEASDDHEAAQIARAHGNGNMVEVWNDHQRVRIVGPEASGRA